MLGSEYSKINTLFVVTRLIACAISLASVVSADDAPKIDRIFPAGLQRGATVEVKLTGKPGDGELKVWTDAGQLAFKFSEKNDTATVTAADEVRPGIHWLRFFNEHGATDLKPFLVGVAHEAAEVEPNNKASEAQAIELPTVTINGVLEKANDVDTYGVTLKAGTTFVASMQAHRDLGSPMDAVLRLLGPNGAVVAHNDDDHEFDPQIVFEVPTDGTYFVRTFAFPATPNSTIGLAGSPDYIYRLTLTSEAFIDHTVPAVVDASANSEVALKGWNLPDSQSPLAVPAFQQSAFALTGDFANVVEVSACGCLSVEEGDVLAQPLELPIAVTGCISEADQTDEFSFHGTKGQKMTIEVASRAMFSPLDPVLTIVDGDGKQLKQADDRSREDLDAEASVTLKADGSHKIRVTDRYSHGGERFVYVLKCVETQADFSTAAKANAFAFTEDEPLEIPIDVSRRNGFMEAIEFTVEGLPDGVIAELVESAKDGDSAKKVTLKLTRSETASAFSGPIRIIGRAKDSGLQHVVAAPIEKLTAQTEHLWLTVPEVKPTAEEPSAEEADVVE